MSFNGLTDDHISRHLQAVAMTAPLAPTPEAMGCSMRAAGRIPCTRRHPHPLKARRRRHQRRPYLRNSHLESPGGRPQPSPPRAPLSPRPYCYGPTPAYDASGCAQPADAAPISRPNLADSGRFSGLQCTDWPPTVGRGAREGAGTPSHPLSRICALRPRELGKDLPAMPDLGHSRRTVAAQFGVFRFRS